MPPSKIEFTPLSLSDSKKCKRVFLNPSQEARSQQLISPLFLYFSSLSPLFLYFSYISHLPILISGSQESAVDVSAEIAEQLQLAETQLSSVKSEQDQLKASLAAMTEERDSMSEKVMNFFNPNGIIFFRLFFNLSSLFFCSFMSQFALCTRREKGII